MRKLVQLVIVLMLALVCSAVPLSAQAKGKRLILKDGSYQIATKWEIQGDRVRYYSAERFDWEELPTSLVNWAATNKYEADTEAGISADRAELSAEEKAERSAEESRSPTIFSGLRLPESGGIFLLDQYAGKPQLVELVQNGTDINKHTGKNILRAVINPLPTGPRQTVELKGDRARVQAHTQSPAIYVNINFDANDDSPATRAQGTDDAESSTVPADQRFKIVRLEEKNDVRVVSNLKIALTGRMKEQQKVVDTQSTAVSKDWLKLSPLSPLPPGEYALIEMLGPKQMNLYVWDFGVDLNAPENPAAWKPEPPKQLPTGTEDSPILQPPIKK